MNDKLKNNPLVIDILAYLKENFEIEAESAEELVESFIESVAEHIKEADTFLESASWTDLSRVGHTLKGSGANVGANALAEVGKMLEFAAKAEDAAACVVSIDKLKELHAELK
jgi:HPt (histidine-containing phosphotransfer) domain-containing protein